MFSSEEWFICPGVLWVEDLRLLTLQAWFTGLWPKLPPRTHQAHVLYRPVRAILRGCRLSREDLENADNTVLRLRSVNWCRDRSHVEVGEIAAFSS